MPAARIVAEICKHTCVFQWLTGIVQWNINPSPVPNGCHNGRSCQTHYISCKEEQRKTLHQVLKEKPDGFQLLHGFVAQIAFAKGSLSDSIVLAGGHEQLDTDDLQDPKLESV